jgi:hypothetical protein
MANVKRPLNAFSPTKDWREVLASMREIEPKSPAIQRAIRQAEKELRHRGRKRRPSFARKWRARMA